MSKMKRMWIGLMLLIFCLSGCVPQANQPQIQATLPPVDLKNIPEAPENCEAVSREAQARIWYPNEAGSQLIYEEHAVSGESQLQLCRLAIDAMLEKGKDRFPGQTKLIQVEYLGDDLAIVDWTLDKRAAEQSIYSLLVCCANTLGSLDVQAVAFRINGAAAQLQGWPVGALTPADSDIHSLWGRLTLESTQTECDRYALIFRAAADGEHIVPELVKVHLKRDQELQALLQAMRSKSGQPGLSKAFPSSTRALSNASLWKGEKIVSLHFDANVLAILQTENIRSSQMYAAAACTCLAFFGQAEGVEMYVSNAQVVRMDKDLSFEDGIMHWQDLASLRAQTASVYLSNGLGSLTAQPRFFTDDNASDPSVLLEMVLSGPASWEKDIYGVSPDSMPSNWLLGVSLVGREARVNLSRRFQTACAKMTAAQERDLIYSMVNTLCQLRDVEMVRFYVEGRALEVFVNEISFLSPLRENQVMVVSQ